MATRFECLLEADPEDTGRARLTAMGEALLSEAAIVERSLSRYDASSELSSVNARAARGPVRVSNLLLRTLVLCDRITRMSGGAFSAAAYPLMEAWGMQGGATGRHPHAGVLRRATRASQWHHVALDPGKQTVAFASDAVSLDLGGIGKGVALDEIRYRASEVGVTHALVHGGTSSILAIGGPFRVGVVNPDNPPGTGGTQPHVPLVTMDLTDEALGVSASFGRTGHDGERRIGHVMDPRSGAVLSEARLAAVRASNAALADAWATALLVDPTLESAQYWPDGVRECRFWQFPEDAE